MSQNKDQAGIKLKVLCERLSVNYDEARYTLARGILPKGVEAEPGRGNHRVFNNAQSFYLAIALKLKAAGITTSLAAMISDWSRGIQFTSCNLGWDGGFAPFAGKLKTEHQWLIEVGDSRYARLATDAHPSKRGLHLMEWVDMETRKECLNARPTVIVRVDVALIAQLLVGRDCPKKPRSLRHSQLR